MYTLCVAERISVALKVRGYDVHGHDVEVRACVRGERLDGAGMLIDAEELRRALREVLKPLDHKYANQVLGLDSVTAELLASWVYSRLRERLSARSAELVSVSVRLGDSVEATYFREPAAST